MSYARCCAKKRREIKHPSQQRLVLFSDSLTIIMLFMFVLNATAATINAWKPYVCKLIPPMQKITCTQLSVFEWITNQYCRALLYLVVIARINLAFHNSAYKYNKKFLYFLYFTVIAFAAIFGVLDIMYVKGEESNDINKDNAPKHTCNSIIPSWIVTSALIFDILFTLLCSYLFIFPLIKIVRNLNDVDVTDYAEQSQTRITGSGSFTQSKDDDLQSINTVNQRTFHLVVKYTNVTTICMFSTIMGLGLLSWSEFTILLTIDNGFVAFSVVLMCSYYQRLYYGMLGCCHRRWMKCCIRCCINHKKRNKLLQRRGSSINH